MILNGNSELTVQQSQLAPFPNLIPALHTMWTQKFNDHVSRMAEIEGLFGATVDLIPGSLLQVMRYPID